MIKKIFVLLMFCFVPFSFAKDNSVAISAKIGTLGAGSDISFAINKNFSIRTGFSFINYEQTLDLTDATLDADVDFAVIPLLLDWHPFGSGFRISLGAFINNNKVDLSSGAQNIILDDQSFQIKSLSGNISVNTIAPYFGIGFGNVSESSRFGIVYDLGIMMQGLPDVQASAIAEDSHIQPALDVALEKEINDLEDDLTILRFYPVASIGIWLRF